MTDWILMDLWLIDDWLINDWWLRNDLLIFCMIDCCLIDESLMTDLWLVRWLFHSFDRFLLERCQQPWAAKDRPEHPAPPWRTLCKEQHSVHCNCAQVHWHKAVYSPNIGPFVHIVSRPARLLKNSPYNTAVSQHHWPAGRAATRQRRALLLSAAETAGLGKP